MPERLPNSPPFFSVITPSYNMLGFLPACCNSVADQGVDYEHIVMDGASTDGTVDWLRSQKHVISISEKDDGMYDAINKGIQISRGEIISYLNCDEQYLPETLVAAKQFFQTHPDVDILFGNALIIQPNGKLLAYRKSFVPRWPYIWASFIYVYTGSMFVRRRVFDSGLRFDKKWRAIGDADFVVRVLRAGFRARHVRQYFSAFMITGSNVSTGGDADLELKAFRDQAPLWLRYSNFITHPLIRMEKLWNGGYREKFPFSYSVYTTENAGTRSEFVVTGASPLWKRWKVDE